MILVTGAAGILGRKIVEDLAANGYEVRAQKRSTSKLAGLDHLLNNPKIDWVDCDIMDFMGLEKIFEGVTHVVHCAAVVSFHQADKEAMFTVNVEGTKNVLAVSQKCDIEKLVHISSVAAIGRAPGNDVITEDTKWEDSRYNTNYAKSKHLGELEVTRAQEEGLKTVILNPSVILGPGDWDSSSMQIFRFMKEGSKFYPPGDVNYVDIRDISFAVSKMLFNDLQEERFILNGGKVPYKYLFGLIAKEFKNKKPSIRVTGVLLKFAYVVEYAKSLITGKRSVITKESILLSKMDFLFSNDKVREALNMEFTPLEESVKWTVAELEKN